MLKIELPGGEFWDEKNNVFITTKPRTLRLEHSLISLTRWEQHYKRRYLSKVSGPKTVKEMCYYFYCMSLDQNVEPWVFENMPMETYQKIVDYINDTMTASEVHDSAPQKKKTIKQEELSSELIYCYMFQLGIPIECEKWHLNNLLMLIRIMSEKNEPPKKMSQKEIMKDYAAINKANKARFHTKG